MKKLSCLYVHGSLSAFEPNDSKIKALRKRMTIIGVNYNSSDTFENTLQIVLNKIDEYKPDIVIGHSRGGILTLTASQYRNFFSVALNPSPKPRHSVMRRLGRNKNNITNRCEIYTKENALTYPERTTLKGKGIILIQTGDEVVNAQESIDHYNQSHHYTLKVIEGGSHNFDNFHLEMDYILFQYQQWKSQQDSL